MTVRLRLANAWRLLRDFSGDSAYETYVAHQQRHHPGEPLLCERDFWRLRTDEQDRNPRQTCC